MASTTTPGVYINPTTKKKTFVPLENNPEVFNDLIKRLGITSKVGFYDVYGIEPELLSMVPRPVHALIFISPAPVWNNVRKTYDGYDGNEKQVTYDAAGDGEPVMWFRQTIGHACGLYSLVHAVGNGSGKDYILKDSLIDRLLKQAKPLKRAERADVLYNSKELEEAHMASAVQGDSIVPSATEPVGFHFITFTKGDDGHLWELEGCWDPIDRGALDESEDMLSERAIELGVGKYVKMSDGNLEFSIIAMCSRPEDE